MPLSGRKRKLVRRSDYESKFCDEEDQVKEASFAEEKTGECSERSKRALRKLKNFYSSSSGQVALGKMKFKQGKLSLVTPRLPGGNVGRNAKAGCGVGSSSEPPKLKKKRSRSQLCVAREAEKENGGRVGFFVISESKEAEEDVGDEAGNAAAGASASFSGSGSNHRVGGLGALVGGVSENGDASDGPRTHREVVRQREEVPHTARLEAYCPSERKSKNILFTPR